MLSASRMPLLRPLAIPLAILLILQCVSLAPAASFAQTETGEATQAQSTKVTIPWGTPVELKFNERIAPETAAVGTTVMLTVAMPVIVGGKTVIAAGAAAAGEVIESSKRGAIGKPGSVGVLAKHVVAADGTIIPLTGTKLIEGKSKQTSAIVITIFCCILGLLQKGENAEIPAGSSIQVTVATAMDVQVQ